MDTFKFLIKFLFWYLKNILISLDQFCNTLFLGFPDETLSSRCYRLSRDGKTNTPRKIVDTLLFFDKNHCEESYMSEKLNRQNAPEFRKFME